jgi:hypothetical protein
MKPPGEGEAGGKDGDGAGPRLLYYGGTARRSWDAMPDMEKLREQLAGLKSEHRDLDDIIQQLIERGPYDPLQIQRLKKRKLVLKDQIARIESKLLPDIIA